MLHQARSDSVVLNLEDVLGKLLAPGATHDSPPGSTAKLVNEAMAMFNTLKSSPGTYEMPMDGRGGPASFRSLDELEMFQVINAKTAAPLRSQELRLARERDQVAQQLALVNPGLVRIADDGEKLVLVKPKIMVLLGSKESAQAIKDEDDEV